MAGRRRIKSASDARRYLANLINRVEAGEVDPNIASKIGYLTNILIKAIETEHIERQVEELEEQLGGGNV